VREGSAGLSFKAASAKEPRLARDEDGDIAQLLGPEPRGGLSERDDGLPSSIEGAVGEAEDVRGDRCVLAQHFGEGAEARAIVVRHVEDALVDVGQDREVGPRQPARPRRRGHFGGCRAVAQRRLLSFHGGSIGPWREN